MSLQGKVAIVTGAGKGIGRACALALAEAGADVVLAARTQADLDALARDIEALGRRALPLACDVGDEESLRQLVARTREGFGRIDVLVNNAGGSGPNDARKTSAAELTHVLQWNVVPTFMMIQLVAPVMREGGYGAVVNISSVAARYAQRGFSAYGAAKAALNQLTRNLAQDYAPHLRINAIEPGTIETEALAPYLTPERRARLVATTPLQRLGQAEDIAAAAVFLASPASSWITGKVLGVDGGVEAPNF